MVRVTSEFAYVRTGMLDTVMQLSGATQLLKPQSLKPETLSFVMDTSQRKTN